jgi:hypothetical protein
MFIISSFFLWNSLENQKTDKLVRKVSFIRTNIKQLMEFYDKF